MADERTVSIKDVRVTVTSRDEPDARDNQGFAKDNEGFGGEDEGSSDRKEEESRERIDT